MLVLTACSSADPAWHSRQDNRLISGAPPATSAAPEAPDTSAIPATPATPTPSSAPHTARRAVPATIVRMPDPPAPPPSPAPPVIAVPQPVGPPSPAPVTSCDAGGCWSGGERYQGSGGNYVTPGGKTCRSNGAFMQCF